MKFNYFLFCITLFLSSFSFSQFEINECELNGNIFYGNCIKYEGNCQNDKANGWGKLQLNNGDAISGLFKENVLQDGYISYYNANKKSYTFGPNKGTALNGPCIYIDYSNYVSLGNYVNNAWVGSSNDFFLTNKPEFIYNTSFSAANQYDAKRKSCKLVPNSKNIIFVSAKEYNSNGDRKYWITVVDLSQNKVIKNFGSFENPIRTATNVKPEEPIFIDFFDNNFALFEIRGNANDPHKYLKCNLLNGTQEIITALPAAYVKIQKFNEKLDEVNYNDLVAIETHVLLGDSSYFKAFNNKAYDESRRNYNTQYGSGFSIIHFNKNHEIITRKDFSNYNIHDFAVDENSNRLAISYRGKDSVYLSYFHTLSLNKITDVFAKVINNDDKSKTGSIGEIQFSNSGSFLLFSIVNRGTTIYMGSELYFGVDGEVYGLNSDENVILSNSSGVVRAYDLEKKVLIWSYDIRDDFYNTSFFNPDGGIYIISGKTTIQHFKMPKPLFSITEFKKNPDFYKRFETVNSSKNNVNTSSTKNQTQNVSASNTKEKEATNADVDRFESYFNSWIGKMMFDELSNYKVGENQQSTQSSSQNSDDEPNAHQCCNCLMVSMGTSKPLGGKYGDCAGALVGSNDKSHSWWEVNTNKGKQCTRCGVKSYILQLSWPSCTRGCKTNTTYGTDMGHDFKSW